MGEIKILRKNEKLDEAYEILCEKLNAICEQYQLNYYEFFGLIKCFECDLMKQNMELEDEEEE